MKKQSNCTHQWMTDLEGEIYCPNCGEVEKERDHNVLSSYKPLDERTEPKSQYHKFSREGGSKGFYDKDSDKKKLPKQNKKYFDRISDEKNYWKTRPENYLDVKRNICYDLIENVLSKNNISTDNLLFDEACMFYDRLAKNKISYRKNNVVLAATCVYFACKNFNYNITLEKISNDIDQNSETLKDKVKNIEKSCRTKHIKIKNQGLDKILLIQKEIERFPNNILPEKLKRRTMIHFPYEKIDHMISSSKKESVASGIIDVVSRENEVNVTPKKIAQVYGISEFSVRRSSKKIQEALEK